MKTNTFQVFSLATALMAVHTSALFVVKEGQTAKAAAGYAKEWTVTKEASSDIVGAIDLSLAGTTFVSFDKSLPIGVLGKVKATSDQQNVVETITVRNNPNHTNKPTNGALNVTSVDGMNGGNLLTEITLSSNSLDVLIISQSAQVVVEDGVLTNDLVIDVGGSSALYVSASKANMDLKDLVLTASDSASVQIHAKSLSIGDVTMDVGGSASVSVLAPTLKTSDIVVTAGDDGTICFSATDASTGEVTIDDGSKVSFPKSSNKFGTTGKFPCDNLKVPARSASSVTQLKKPASLQKAAKGAANGDAVGFGDEDDTGFGDEDDTGFGDEDDTGFGDEDDTGFGDEDGAW
ncbi:hypothetical protein P3T76_011373 [Phytophthora citrophthora]|uniref:Auto-transporter adhesin head GIN domain-containing protein n=1 Tax=Phytophthora citrophthora TaxID=4793 RepID=A0AAD9G9G9_9STRA|nr:hypothetical protein P3T76_011373 [Phytophthora citrophthora]